MKKDAIALRKETNKEALIKQLKSTPVVEVACKKVGIGRASYYRWRKEDPEFSEMADEALFSGKNLINDLAESQLIRAIQEGNMTSIIFWLKHHHNDYRTRLELSGRIEAIGKRLTPEQEEAIENALKLAALDGGSSINNQPNHE